MLRNETLPILMQIQQVCDRILKAGELTHEEHMQLMTYCLNDTLVNESERQSITKVLDEIQFGNLKFISQKSLV